MYSKHLHETNGILFLDPSEYHLDDLCVIQLLKGLCLRHLGSLVPAELCFNQVIARLDHFKYNCNTHMGIKFL